MQQTIIGIDGGGTRTRALLHNLDTGFIGYGEATASNPNNVGFPNAAKAILSAISKAGEFPSSETVLCLGIAGIVDAHVADNLRQQLFNQEPSLRVANLFITHDLEIAHHAAFNGLPGVLIIAGTGSACYSVDESGKSFRASGRASGFDDPGSGYSIAKRAMEVGILPLESTLNRTDIAANAKHVVKRAASGDAASLRLLKREAAELAKLANPVILASTSDRRIQVALLGGMVEPDIIYRRLLEKEFTTRHANLTFIVPRAPAVIGAFAIAYRNATGSRPSEAALAQLRAQVSA